MAAPGAGAGTLEAAAGAAAGAGAGGARTMLDEVGYADAADDYQVYMGSFDNAAACVVVALLAMLRGGVGVAAPGGAVLPSVRDEDALALPIEGAFLKLSLAVFGLRDLTFGRWSSSAPTGSRRTLGLRGAWYGSGAADEAAEFHGRGKRRTGEAGPVAGFALRRS